MASVDEDMAPVDEDKVQGAPSHPLPLADGSFPAQARTACWPQAHGRKLEYRVRGRGGHGPPIECGIDGMCGERRDRRARRLGSRADPCAIRRPGTVRPRRRRPDRSGPAGGRERRSRHRAVRYRDRDQILQGRRRQVAARALPARPRLCGRSTMAGRRRRLSQGDRQGQHDRHGRARRDVRDRHRRAQGRSPGADVVRARRRGRQSARRHQSGGAHRRRAHHPTPGREPCS